MFCDVLDTRIHAASARTDHVATVQETKVPQYCHERKWQSRLCKFAVVQSPLDSPSTLRIHHISTRTSHARQFGIFACILQRYIC